MQSLSKDELLALLKEAKASRERDWLMILVAYWHGLRTSEVTGFTRDAVQDEHLTIQRLKGSLRTVQPLIDHQEPLLSERQALIDFCSKASFNQPVFKVGRRHFWRLVQKYAKAAGIPAHKRHPHVLKHSIAMQTIHAAGIENVRQYLGHKSKSISSTGAYLKVTDADAASAIAKAAIDCLIFFAESEMGRGGKRPGAGRKPKPVKLIDAEHTQTNPDRADGKPVDQAIKYTPTKPPRAPRPSLSKQVKAQSSGEDLTPILQESLKQAMERKWQY